MTIGQYRPCATICSGKLNPVAQWFKLSIALTSPENLLEMQILECHPLPTESETVGWGPATCVLTSLPGISDTQYR